MNLDTFSKDLINTRKDFVNKGKVADLTNSIKDKASDFKGGVADALSNIEKYFNRSLFDSQTINETAVGKDGYYVIRIEPIDNGIRHVADYSKGSGNNYSGPTSIVGVIEKFPNFSMNASWSEQGGLTNIAPSIGVLKMLDGLGNMGNNAFKRGGVAERGQKFQSKKVYSKSGYLDFDVTFKCINWDGTPENSPMNVALTLFSYTLPMSKFSIWEFIKQDLSAGIDAAKKMVDEAMASGDPIKIKALKEQIDVGVKAGTSFLPENIRTALAGFSKELGTKVDKTTKSIFAEAEVAGKVVGESGAVDNVIAMGKNMLEYIDDYGIFRAAPAQVKITIGKFFQNNDMVIENVSVKISEEMTDCGPLWADFTVKLSTRTIMTDASELGFKVWNGKSFSEIPKPKDEEVTVPPDVVKNAPNQYAGASTGKKTGGRGTAGAKPVDQNKVPASTTKSAVATQTGPQKAATAAANKAKTDKILKDASTVAEKSKRISFQSQFESMPINTTMVYKSLPKPPPPRREDRLIAGNSMWRWQFPWS